LLIRRHVLLSRNAMRLALDRGLIIHRSRSTVNLLEVCISMLGLVTLSTASYDQGSATMPRASRLRSSLMLRQVD
jgi:hypothetical protein